MSIVTTGRPIFSTFERGKLKIIYHAEVADEVTCAHKCYGCLCPWTCMCYEPLSKTIRQSTFVTVYENKIEYNYPQSRVLCSFPDIWRCNCAVYDYTGIIYFDRAVVQNAAKAEPCTPCCTHNSCFPTCCGCFGETVVLYENVPGCGACCGGACSHICTCCVAQNVGVIAPGVVPRHLCAAEHVVLPCVKDATGLAAAINEVRNKRLNAQHIEVEMAMTR